MSYQDDSKKAKRVLSARENSVFYRFRGKHAEIVKKLSKQAYKALSFLSVDSPDAALELMQKDLSENTEFRIKYPRGELGQSQNDLEQFMLIEDLYKSVDTMQKHLDSMANNKINIEFLNKQMDKVINDIEKLKDADRDIKYENGNH